MAASPEFYKPSPPPCGSPLLADACDDEGYYCRTPTDADIKEPATCPSAPRKPRPPPAACRKRLFDVQVLSLCSEELDRLFRPQPQCDKRRRSPDKRARPSDHQQA